MLPTYALGADKWPNKELYFDPATFTQKQWAHPEDAVAFAFQRISFDHVPFWNGQWHVRGIDRSRHAILLGEGGRQQLLFHYLQVYLPGIYPNQRCAHPVLSGKPGQPCRGRKQTPAQAVPPWREAAPPRSRAEGAGVRGRTTEVVPPCGTALPQTLEPTFRLPTNSSSISIFHPLFPLSGEGNPALRGRVRGFLISAHPASIVKN